MKHNKILSVLLAILMLASIVSAEIVFADNSLVVEDNGNDIKLDEKWAADDAKLHREEPVNFNVEVVNEDGTKKSLTEDNKKEVVEESLNVKDRAASNEEYVSSEKVDKEVVKPETMELPNSSIPNRISCNINGDAKTQRGFNWYTNKREESSRVWVSESEDMSDAISFDAEVETVESLYLERDKKGFFLFGLYDRKTNKPIRYFTDEGKTPVMWNQKSEVKDKNTQYVHILVNKVREYSYKALATGLKSDTIYYYTVGSDEYKSPVGRFKTSSEDGVPFKFIHYTDTQNAWWNEHLIDEGAYCADTIKKAQETVPDADFVMHTGDIVEIAGAEDEWVDLFNKSQESFLNMTLVPIAGNHDEYGFNYNGRLPYVFNQHFNVPSEGEINGGSYYSYDYNGVHFVMLNTNDYKSNGAALSPRQLNWIRRDVKEARRNGAKWVVLCYHKPLFSKSYHSLSDRDVQNVRDDFMKLIDELDIDVCLQGHDHVISRTKSLGYVPKEESVFNAKVVDEVEKRNGVDLYKMPKGTTFVLPNTGGTKAYNDIYDSGLSYLHKVKENLKWMTEELLEEYNNLFAYGEQPFKSKAYENGLSNYRDSDVQNFAVYEVRDDEFIGKLYQIEGKLGTKREPRLVDEFVISKKTEKNENKEEPKEEPKDEDKPHFPIIPDYPVYPELEIDRPSYNYKKAHTDLSGVKKDKKVEPKAEIKPVETSNDYGIIKTVPAISVNLTDIPQGENGEAIINMVQRGILKGMTDTTFEGELPISRAMIAEVLMRLSVDKSSAEVNFSDVKSTDWFNSAVKWGVAQGIFKGYEDGTFKANGKVSRQEFAVIMYRFLKEHKINLPVVNANVNFKDVNNVPEWSKEAVIEMAKVGLVNAKDGSSYNPTSEFTRNELASALNKIVMWVEAN